MRAIFEPQFELGHTPIEEITFDVRSRDNIPAALRGLQDIFTHQKTSERESHPDFVEARRERPAIESAIINLNRRGMSLVRTHHKVGFER